MIVSKMTAEDTTAVSLRATNSMDRQVHFADRICIKEYVVELGDNPACSSGPPIQLGWKVESTTERNFQFYEFFRSSERLRGKELKIPAQEREDMLVMTLGYKLSECLEAEQQIKVDRKNRVESLKNAEWDRLSILFFRGQTTSRLVYPENHPHLRRRAATDDDIVMPDPSLDRRRRLRSFVSFRRERGIEPPASFIEALACEKEKEDGHSRPNFQKQRQFRSFVSFGGGETPSSFHQDNCDSDRPIFNRARQRRSFVVQRRQDQRDDMVSPSKLGKGFLKSTGEMMKTFTQLSPPFTKNARMA